MALEGYSTPKRHCSKVLSAGGAVSLVNGLSESGSRKRLRKEALKTRSPLVRANCVGEVGIRTIDDFGL